jgi:hypothetical protein
VLLSIEPTTASTTFVDKGKKRKGWGCFAMEEEDRAPPRRGVIWPSTRSRWRLYRAKGGSASPKLMIFETCLANIVEGSLHEVQGKGARPGPNGPGLPERGWDSAEYYA